MKILIISQHLFPIQTPRAHRTSELVKEFGKQGHEVTVYAVLGKFNYSNFEKQFNVTVKNIPIKFQKRPYNSDGPSRRAFIDKVLGKLFGKIFEFPNIEFMLNIPNIIRNEPKADLLISIADPHQIHWGCSRAKQKYPLQFPKKWIADCGDPFMANVKNKFHYKFYAKYEKRFCRLCDFITVPINEAVEGYYPEFRNKIRILPQGFDFQELPSSDHISTNKVPTFAYAGIFYKDIRNPNLFFNYLKTIDKNYKFIIYTPYKDLIASYENILRDKLEVKAPIDREQLIVKLKEMDFLVNIENINCPTQLPSKLIDYAIAGKPILSINNANFETRVIDEFLSGNYSNRFIVKSIEQYQIKNVVKKLLEFLNE